MYLRKNQAREAWLLKDEDEKVEVSAQIYTGYEGLNVSVAGLIVLSPV
jgi:hypothetical protein